MNALVAALPMYDWPETREETDAVWVRIREALRGVGIDAPDKLSRCNADLPAVPGGIRDAKGNVVAPDPAALDPDAFDLSTAWRHPGLLLGQTCWGPMELGLASLVEVVGQPDYSGIEGAEGPFYSSTILMRRDNRHDAVEASSEGRGVLPLDRLRGTRLAFNSPDSMSGYLALQRDLASLGEDMSIFVGMIETQGHRASVKTVAEGSADVCVVDCRSWDLAKRFEPAAEMVAPVGWTARRKGLPYVASAALPRRIIDETRKVLEKLRI